MPEDLKLRPYTPEDIAFIEANWQTMTDAEMGEVLGRSSGSVTGARGRRGWRRAPVSPRWPPRPSGPAASRWPRSNGRATIRLTPRRA